MGSAYDVLMCFGSRGRLWKVMIGPASSLPECDPEQSTPLPKPLRGWSMTQGHFPPSWDHRSELKRRPRRQKKSASPTRRKGANHHRRIVAVCWCPELGEFIQ